MVRMRILHVTSSLGGGGAEATLRKLVLADTENHHLIFSLTDGGEWVSDLVAANVEVLGGGEGKTIQSVVSSFFDLRRLVRAQSPDLIQTWMYHADLIGGLAARSVGEGRISWNLRGTPPRLPGDRILTYLLVRLLALLSWVIPRTIVSCSESGSRQHGRLGYDLRKIVVIPNGFDSVFWSAPRPKSAPSCDPSPNEKPTVTIGMVARFHPKKNFPLFLEAMRNLTAKGHIVRAVVVGAGATTSNPRFLKIVKDLNFPTHILTAEGPSMDVRKVFSQLDLLVLPSRWGEGFPNVLAEAMLCGVPCITSNSGDSEKIVGSAGWVFHRSKAQMLELLLLQAMAEGPEGRAERGRAGRRHVSDLFTVDKMVAKYRKVFAETALA